MNIGVDCFLDDEVRSIIKTYGKLGRCDITNVDGVMVYDTSSMMSDLPEYISEIIDVYTPESELEGFPENRLKNIEEVLASDWSLFLVGAEEIKKIVMDLCKDIYPTDSKIYSERVGLEVLSNSYFLSEQCLTKESTWEEFVLSLKTVNRFHSSSINLKQFEKMFENPNFQYEIKRGESNFYRGRVSERRLTDKEMGPPPSDLATAGRANSRGISCLYLSNNMETTLHEIRARDLDNVTIGIFEATEDLQIIDLAGLDQISPFSVSDVFSYEWLAVNMPLLKRINSEIAKPIRRNDSELDYLPAQYISDFIKSLGYDGIRYKSTLSCDGMNYAVFDKEKFTCIKTEFIHVKELNYDYEIESLVC